jgi:hypothetical protein
MSKPRCIPNDRLGGKNANVKTKISEHLHGGERNMKNSVLYCKVWQ